MHFLLKEIYHYPIKKQKQELYKNYTYDSILGFWKSLKTNQPLIFDTSFIIPRTKKADIETGEDQKGQ